MVDLHVHSTHSDGTLSPTQLVEEAMWAGLAALALTDHDTISGNDEFLAAAAARGLAVIAGVEISAQYENPEPDGSRDGEMHILGYFPTWNTSTAERLAPLSHIRSGRNERNPKIIARLRELGCELSYAEVAEHAGNEVVGRPHIAAVLVAKGYAKNSQDAFNRFLAKGAPAYVPKAIFPQREAVQLIAQAGGIPVLAHPKLLGITSVKLLEQLVESLIDAGLRGIEVYYSTHQPAEIECYRAIAHRYGLLITGGSDFHGANKPRIQLGRGFGSLNVPDSCATALLELVT